MFQITYTLREDNGSVKFNRELNNADALRAFLEVMDGLIYSYKIVDEKGNESDVEREWVRHEKKYYSLDKGEPECFVKDLFEVHVTPVCVYTTSYYGGVYEEWEEIFCVNPKNITIQELTDWIMARYGSMPDRVTGLSHLKDGNEALHDSWC